MRIRIKRKNGVILGVTFKAETSAEGVCLKDAVLASAKRGLSVETLIEELDRAGFEVEPPKLKVIR
jgi:hypothetical protein